MSFSKLGLSQQIQTTIAKLGYETPTPVQAQAIPMVLAKRDVMAGAQTGTGKTGAFALPIIDMLSAQASQSNAIRGLVLTPTRELAQQVCKSFVEYAQGTDLKIGLAYGGVSLNPQIKALKDGCDILVATPGRLLDLLFKGTFDLDSIEHLVFDEADRMLDMGFMVDIKRILKRVPDERQTMLFSATFDQAIFDLSKRLLNQPELIEVAQRNTTASEIEQIIYNVDEDKKRELTSFMIGSKNWQQVLIFVRTRQGAEALAKEMCKDGVKAQSIHGDKSQGAREKALEEFKSGKTRALVATDVAARGLDIEQLNYVINYELPYIAEDYIHRIGRTGRAEAEGEAITFVTPANFLALKKLEKLIRVTVPRKKAEGFKYDARPVEEKRPRKKKEEEKKSHFETPSKFSLKNKPGSGPRKSGPGAKPSRKPVKGAPKRKRR